MPIPSRDIIKEALVWFIYREGGASHEVRTEKAYEGVAKELKLTAEDRSLVRGNEPHWENELRWAREDLVGEGAILPPAEAGWGIWKLSGKTVQMLELASKPEFVPAASPAKPEGVVSVVGTSKNSPLTEPFLTGSKTVLITNGHIIDPANGIDRVGDVYFADGKITRIDLDGSVRKQPQEVEVIDASGLVVAPGLIDLHVHFREPGQSAKETIATGAKAAAAGGFTSVVCMPNTSPSVDNPSVVTWILEKAKAEACVNVFPTGAITKGIAGEELAPIGTMHKAGIVALTDDGHCIQNHEVMRRALEYARMFGLVVMDHCQDYNLVGKGVMHEGRVSVELGLPGWPAAGEEIIVQRNALLAELCDTPIHCQHLSAGGSVRLLREARARGVKLSGEVCPHHIAITDEAIRSFDTNFKMNPPLRAQQDVDLLIEGIADGTITVLASDHAPHCGYEKEVEFDQAPFGILGLETELGLFIDILVHKKKAVPLRRVVEMLTVEPARLLGLDRGTLSVGAPADVTLIDPDLEWKVDREASQSRSRNTPFHGWELKGRAVRTIVSGKTVWSL